MTQTIDTLLDPVKNFAKVTVSIPYDNTAVNILIDAGQGAKLPNPTIDGAFNLVWWNYTDYPDPSDDPNKEIVRCTARSTDTLTITRAQEGTTATVKNIIGKIYKMVLAPTKKTIDDIISTVSAHAIEKLNIHGFDSNGMLTSMPVSNRSQVKLSAISNEASSIYSDLNGSIHICTNCYYNGMWLRYDGLIGASRMVLQNGSIYRYAASAGTNPISWDLMDGIVISDTFGRSTVSTLATQLRMQYWTAAFAEKVDVQNVWVQQYGAGTLTDYEDLLAGAAGWMAQSGLSANFDEVKWPNIILNAGTYKIGIAHTSLNNGGILEILHGTTSIGTKDTYSAGFNVNQTAVFTYTPTIRTVADIRLRANGKNVASTGYIIEVSRIEIIRTG